MALPFSCESNRISHFRNEWKFSVTTIIKSLIVCGTYFSQFNDPVLHEFILYTTSSYSFQWEYLRGKKAAFND